jgi:hypothetical protein
LKGSLIFLPIKSTSSQGKRFATCVPSLGLHPSFRSGEVTSGTVLSRS